MEMKQVNGKGTSCGQCAIRMLTFSVCNNIEMYKSNSANTKLSGNGQIATLLRLHRSENK